MPGTILSILQPLFQIILKQLYEVGPLLSSFLDEEVKLKKFHNFPDDA